MRIRCTICQWFAFGQDATRARGKVDVSPRRIWSPEYVREAQGAPRPSTIRALPAHQAEQGLRHRYVPRQFELYQLIKQNKGYATGTYPVYVLTVHQAEQEQCHQCISHQSWLYEHIKQIKTMLPVYTGPPKSGFYKRIKNNKHYTTGK